MSVSKISTSIQKLTLTVGSVTMGDVYVNVANQDYGLDIVYTGNQAPNAISDVSQGTIKIYVTFSITEKSDYSNIPTQLILASLSLGVSATLLFEGQQPNTLAGNTGWIYDGGVKTLYNGAVCSTLDRAYNGMNVVHTYTFLCTEHPITIAPAQL